MPDRGRTGAMALMASLLAAFFMTTTGAAAFDEAQYPDWSGQWKRPRGVGTQWDQTKPGGLGQQAPLTAEYQTILEASIRDQAAGGQGADAHVTCVSNGVPRIMTVTFPIEFVILPPSPTSISKPSCRAASTPTGAISRPMRSRAIRAIPSAAGSTPTVTAASTRLRSRPATSRGRAPTKTAACRSMPTMQASSRSASRSTGPTPTSCTTRSPRSIMR